MPTEDDDNEIIVEAPRIKDDDGDLGGGGFGSGFWPGSGGDVFDFTPGFGGGSGGGAPPAEEEPADEADADEGPEIVVTAPRQDQSEFDDDGDVFNDGSAPYYQTVVDWLWAQHEAGIIVSFQIVQTDPDNPEVYEGKYETIGGERYEFESDGAENYENFLRSAPLPEPPLPIDPNDIALGPLGPEIPTDYALL